LHGIQAQANLLALEIPVFYLYSLAKSSAQNEVPSQEKLNTTKNHKPSIANLKPNLRNLTPARNQTYA
jgi:hypothetical protein